MEFFLSERFCFRWNYSRNESIESKNHRKLVRPYLLYNVFAPGTAIEQVVAGANFKVIRVKIFLHIFLPIHTLRILLTIYKPNLKLSYFIVI